MVKTAILVSGGGTNLQAIVDAHNSGNIPNCELTAVISSAPDAYALTRAKFAGINTYVVDVTSFPTRRDFSDAILRTLRDLDIELVVLAGFNFVLGSVVIRQYENRIINIHPSLIPSFCGNGYYGLRVHEKALEYGVKLSGATVHFVTEETDAGPIILQQAVRVHESDTPETLQRRIMEQAEWKLLPKAIALYCRRGISVSGRVVHIADYAQEE